MRTLLTLALLLTFAAVPARANQIVQDFDIFLSDNDPTQQIEIAGFDEVGADDILTDVEIAWTITRFFRSAYFNPSDEPLSGTVDGGAGTRVAVDSMGYGYGPDHLTGFALLDEDRTVGELTYTDLPTRERIELDLFDTASGSVHFTRADEALAFFVGDHVFLNLLATISGLGDPGGLFTADDDPVYGATIAGSVTYNTLAPEPSTLAMAGIGALVLGGCAVRRRARRWRSR